MKFCGNCNPLIDMAAVLKELRGMADGMSFVGWEDEEYDVLLVLGGCERDCATRPPFAGPVVVATDTAVDLWPVARHQLPAAILAALAAHAGGTNTGGANATKGGEAPRAASSTRTERE